LVVEVSKEAAQELEESAAWYEQESPALGLVWLTLLPTPCAFLKNPIRRSLPWVAKPAAAGPNDCFYIAFPFPSLPWAVGRPRLSLHSPIIPASRVTG